MPETVRTAFADRSLPLLSYGTPYPEATARHVRDTFHASRVYIICSGSLARSTDALQKLKKALGEKLVAGVRVGMKSHTLWSEVVEIIKDARAVEADLILTLGAGSLTDGAKIVALVCSSLCLDWECMLICVGPCKQCTEHRRPLNPPPRPQQTLRHSPLLHPYPSNPHLPLCRRILQLRRRHQRHRSRCPQTQLPVPNPRPAPGHPRPSPNRAHARLDLAEHGRARGGPLRRDVVCDAWADGYE